MTPEEWRRLQEQMAPALEAIAQNQVNFARQFEATFKPLQEQFAQYHQMFEVIAEVSRPARELAERVNDLFAGLDWAVVASQSRTVGAELDIRWAVEELPKKATQPRDVVYDVMALLSFLTALIAIGMFASDAQRAEALTVCSGLFFFLAEMWNREGEA